MVARAHAADQAHGLALSTSNRMDVDGGGRGIRASSLCHAYERCHGFFEVLQSDAHRRDPDRGIRRRRWLDRHEAAIGLALVADQAEVKHRFPGDAVRSIGRQAHPAPFERSQVADVGHLPDLPIQRADAPEWIR